MRSRERVDSYTERVSYRSSPLLRRLLLAAPLVIVTTLLLASPTLAATGLDPLLPNAVSANGHDLYNLYVGISIPALLVFFLVEGLLLTIIIRDRRRRQRPGYVPPQWHGNTRLEIAWTIAPAIILVFIGTFSFVVLQRDFQRPTDAATDLDVAVSGHQFGWIYTYPNGVEVRSEGLAADSSPLVVPTGKLVRLKLSSVDVIHSFWVPDLTGKTDLVPGYDNYTWFKVPQPGEWRGECAELCGAGHYTMQLRVKAVTPDEFDDWLAQQKAKQASPSPGAGAAASPSPSAPASASPSASPSAGASPSPSPSGSAAPSPSPSGSAQPSASPSP
jgi:cytochrome c oxidase subunit 2